jgi:hypothetical protein
MTAEQHCIFAGSQSRSIVVQGALEKCGDRDSLKGDCPFVCAEAWSYHIGRWLGCSDALFVRGNIWDRRLKREKTEIEPLLIAAAAEHDCQE